MKQSNSASIITVGKSKRLDAMRNKVNLNKDKSILIDTHNNLRQQRKNELPQPAKEALQGVRLLVEERMSKILNGYPQGKSHTFFKLKYGIEVAKINALPVREVFDVLALNTSLVMHFKLVQHLDINGFGH